MLVLLVVVVCTGPGETASFSGSPGCLYVITPRRDPVIASHSTSGAHRQLVSSLVHASKDSLLAGAEVVTMVAGTDSKRHESHSMAQTSKFFSVPAEICHEIYFLAFDIPRTPVILRSLSLGSEAHTEREWDGLQFEYFVETPSGLELRQVAMSRFKICRQIYAEITNLYFERSTWAFGNASRLLQALRTTPLALQSQICSLAIWIDPGRVVCTEQMWQPKSYKQHITCSIKELGTVARRLRALPRLRVLQLYIDLAAFRRQKAPNLLPRDRYPVEDWQHGYDFSAVDAIRVFVWDGLETRISLAEADLGQLKAEGLWAGLACCFGTTNIQWVPRSEDRYCGVMGDIVITGERRQIPEPRQPAHLCSDLLYIM